MYRAAELNVNGRVLRGVIRTPEGPGPFPTVIFFHGLNVDRTGLMRLHELFSREVEKEGFACVRFDFYGLGESDGVFSDMTVSNEMEEAKAIYEWTCQQPEVDADNIILSGHSLGSIIASIVALEIQPKSLLLWSPAKTMYYQAGFRTRNTVGPYEGGWDIGGMVLGTAFMEEVWKMDFLKMAEGYKGDVMIIHGELDEQIPVEVVREYELVYGGKMQSYIVKGANHQYSSMDWKAQVYEQSIRFLKEQMGW